MFKIQIIKPIWNLEFGILNLFRISNFRFRVFKSLTFQTMNYGKEASQKYQKVYQERKGADSPGSFGYERTRKINSRTISKNGRKIKN